MHGAAWVGLPGRSEYCLRAQFAQYAQYRALFESYQARMWQWYEYAKMPYDSCMTHKRPPPFK